MAVGRKSLWPPGAVVCPCRRGDNPANILDWITHGDGLSKSEDLERGVEGRGRGVWGVEVSWQTDISEITFSFSIILTDYLSCGTKTR